MEPGDRIAGKYRIVRLIGEGGMGAVYEAIHEGLGIGVALKFLLSELVSRDTLVERFKKEAQLSARINSPHVARVTDVEELPDGTPYLVMELLRGESLQSLLSRSIAPGQSSHLSQEQAVTIAQQILDGLIAAHRLGIVHRDLKPDNVFITEHAGASLVKILDFGIAKLKTTEEFQRILTKPGSVMGTPEYMAPEQAFSADTADVRSDLYSLGVILYEMLSGHLPATGDTAQLIAEQVITRGIVPLHVKNPEVPRGLSTLVSRALAANPDHRFQSAEEMRAELSQFGHSGPPGPTQSAVPGSLAASFAPRSITPQQYLEGYGSQGPTEPVAPMTSAAPGPGVAQRDGQIVDRTKVDSTLPPSDDRPPAIVRDQRLGAVPPTLDGDNRGSARERHPLRWRWLVLGLLLVAAAVFGALIWQDFNAPVRPPLPMPRRASVEAQTRSVTPERRTDTEQDPDVATDPQDEPRSQSRPAPTPTSPGPSTVRSQNNPSTAPTVTVPSIELPPGLLTLPSSLPSALPRLSDLPGLIPTASPVASAGAGNPSSTEDSKP